MAARTVAGGEKAVSVAVLGVAKRLEGNGGWIDMVWAVVPKVGGFASLSPFKCWPPRAPPAPPR